MNMDKVFSKLKHYNRKNYLQLYFCVSFAIFLITSFAATLYSPTVQLVLPIGGDSRKQILLIFGIAVIGCLVFAIYAASLFFKYKSKETGVFLALGTSKEVLAKTLYKELGKILATCLLIGIVIGNVASFLIWQLFRYLVIDSSQMAYRFSPNGSLIGLLFGLIVGLCIFVLAIVFMKRSNLMDILNEQRKNEPIQEVTRRYGAVGFGLIIVGLFLGYGVPSIVTNVFKYNLPVIWNLTYGLAVIGIYQVVTYLISHHERGNNPQKYYNHLISFSMMKSQGKQTVRNMCVMTLLVLASLFALFYVPMQSVAFWDIAERPSDFSLFYPANVNQLNRQEIQNLAKKNNVEIFNYQEVTFSELIASGVDRGWTDKGELIEKYQEKLQIAEFLSVTDYQKITGEKLNLPRGEYYILVDGQEGFFEKYDDLDQVTNPETKQSMELSFAGSKNDKKLSRNGINRYVLNDTDFLNITGQGLSANHQLKQIIFNIHKVSGENKFAHDVFNQFIKKSPKEMARYVLYDAYQAKNTSETGEKYSYGDLIELNSDDPELSRNWKYYPEIKIIMSQFFLRDMAVYLLLFIYVAIICLAAVGIIAYTRSITIGINNKQLFDDLVKLGANKKYIQKTVREQLKKIFVFPTVIGSIVMILYTLLIYWGNDQVMTASEIKSFGVDLILTLIVAIYILIIYRLSYRKLIKIIYQ